MLTTEELARRWGVSASTLAKWRGRGCGPEWVKLGLSLRAAVRYPLAAVETYEDEQSRVPVPLRGGRDAKR